MKRALLTLLFSLSLLNGAEMGLNGGGCKLAQAGAIQLNIANITYPNASYSASAKSGKNFREIFVGSTINVKETQLKIVDYKPNKRVRGKPKTGVFMVEVTTPSLSKTITMAYIFDAGIISATGVFNRASLGFTTKVDYSLCSVSIKK